MSEDGMEQIPAAEVERVMRVREVILRAMSKKISWWQAAEILGVSPRTMRRWKQQFDEYGARSLFDGRKGKPNWRRAPAAEIEKVLALYRDQYFDLNVRHFHEKLQQEHHIGWSYTWVKNVLQGAGLVMKRRSREKHRKRRPRKTLPGMMLHIDGSHHQWFQDGRWYDLIVIVDDATSEIYYAQLVEDESTRTVMIALRHVIEQRGWFASLYSDRASHFFYTPKANQSIDPDQLTQVGRALKELGIQMIPSYSPQARGRSERGFRTWQGRLPQELRLRQILTLEDANRFLQDHYMAEFNAKFAVAAKQKGSAFVPLHRQLELDRIFSIQQERVVNQDNTIRWANVILQIEPTRLRSTLAGCRVIVYEHLDQTVSIGWGPHTVGRYTLAGTPLDDPRVQLVARPYKKKSALRGRGADFFVNKVTSAAR
jgi:transposase